MAKNLNYLGIDLSGASIKLVELRNAGNGRPQLVTYGFIDETYNIIKDDNPVARAAIAKQLQDLIKQTRAGSASAVTALPSFSVFSSIINLPAMKDKDLVSAIRWEAKKFVPIPLEEMILDWEVLKEPAGPKPAAPAAGADSGNPDGKKEIGAPAPKANLRILMTAAPKNLVNRYVELFKMVGLQLVGLETESFALERSLVGNDMNPVMVIDIGGQTSSIIIFSSGVPILNRSIDVGGKGITRSLQETMGLTAAQAEQFKRDVSRSISGDAASKLPKPMSYVINSIINEIRYILNIYQNQNKKPITKVIITGGSAFLANISSSIESIFNIKSFIGDPWARVIHPIEINSLLKELGPRMSVSIGLAMREIV
ncbi:MAG: pilus assembly protein PilM [Patescibacteria group bacterium]